MSPEAASGRSNELAGLRSGQDTASRARSAADSLGSGARLAWSRLHCRSTWWTAVVAVSASGALGAVERSARSYGAADRTIVAFVSLVIPILCLALVRIVIGRCSLRESLWPVARWGKGGGGLAAGLLLVTAAVASAMAALCAAAALCVAHAFGPKLAADLVTTGWIVVLGASCYVGFLGAGATVGKRGGGRWAAWLLDFVLGSGLGAVAAAWPRAHPANLVGDWPVLDWSQARSSAALALLTAGWIAVASARCRG